MCRRIKILRNIEPEASDTEAPGAALQYVRKISGYCHPSQVNTEAFEKAVDEISIISRQLLRTLVTRPKTIATNT